ncbi:MAG TPA: hypothetical protein DCQ34_11000 [Chitinophagaceae bacterium]|nr:hypothetical protein [Chitinophagaceae bacterium]HCY88845.1 hypothetical protein [Chitinophagaceae bacterium]
MQYIYQAYSKQVNGTETFFVKRFLHFPNLAHVPDVQDGFGMHTDFIKACKLAGISDPDIINQILDGMREPAQPAKVINIVQLPQEEVRSNVG